VIAIAGVEELATWIGLPGVPVAVLIGVTPDPVVTYAVFPSGVITISPVK
jgi:hypothetical protein